MSHRLTVNEFELLKKSLECLETMAQSVAFDDPRKASAKFIEAFGLKRVDHIEAAEKLRLLREKIQYIAGE